VRAAAHEQATPRVGVDAALSHVLDALGIDKGAVHWKQDAGAADAAERVTAAIEWRASHPRKP